MANIDIPPKAKRILEKRKERSMEQNHIISLAAAKSSTKVHWLVDELMKYV